MVVVYNVAPSVGRMLLWPRRSIRYHLRSLGAEAQLGFPIIEEYDCGLMSTKPGEIVVFTL